MRCYACNHILSKQEATRKFTESGAFTELCNTCLASIDEDELSLEEGSYEEEGDEE